MDDELKLGLINKRGLFDKQYEEALISVDKIREKNDILQNTSRTDIQEQANQKIFSQSEFMEREISNLRESLNNLENSFVDLQSKSKIKQLKADAQKQIERNKIILKDFINKQSFPKTSQKENKKDNLALLSERGQIVYKYSDHNLRKETDSLTTANLPQQYQKWVESQLDSMILVQNNWQTHEEEQNSIQNKKAIKEMNFQLQFQSNSLYQISQELIQTKKNVNDAKSKIQKENVQQKKSRKKYIILGVVITLLILAGVGVIVFLN